MWLPADFLRLIWDRIHSTIDSITRGRWMNKNIVLLSDGTGNSAAKLQRTNVWRVYQALDQTTASQVAYYDNGVGSSAFKPLALLGGAFGWGLKRNILGLYVFLCRNYVEGDRIYGFGFSRGAFTIRVLTNFVLSKGLVDNFESTSDLKKKARKLYRDFRREQSRKQGRFRLSHVWRGIAYLIRKPFEPKSIATRSVSRVRFLGLWDTVDAYGLPFEEMKHGIDRFIWPLALEDAKLDERIDKACHALSIDDKRTSFHPLLWDETRSNVEHHHTLQEKLTQVWFAGAHANVGGGYPDDGLSYVSLRWMINEASRYKELLFNARAVEDIKITAAPFGRLYDARSGIGAYYRYGPRWLSPPTDKQNATIPVPKIHETVFWRMTAGTDSYAPLNLPNEFRVVTDNEVVVGETTASGETRNSPNVANIFKFADFQSLAKDWQHTQSTYRELPKLQNLQHANRETLGLVWATVWWRRVAYFATLLVTALLVFWPSLPTVFSGDLWSFIFSPTPAVQIALQIFDAVADVLKVALIGIMDFLNSLLPTTLRPWLENHKATPWTFVVLILLLAATITWGAILDRRIQDRALASWNATWSERLGEAQNRLVRRRILLGLVTAVAMGVIAQQFWRTSTRSSHVDWAGITLAYPSFENFVQSFIANNTRYLAVACILVSALALLYSAFTVWLWHRRTNFPPSLALKFANFLQNQPTIRRSQQAFNGLLPLIFAVVLIVTALSAANRFAFAVAAQGGWVCPRPGLAATQLKSKEERKFPLHANEACQTSDVLIDKGAVYEIAVLEAMDETVSWDVPFPSFGRQFLFPMLRRFDAAWYQPIVRFGALSRESSDEFIIGKTPRKIHARVDGRLFVFANDAVIGLIPTHWSYFYQFNSGSAIVRVIKLRDPDPE
jgi:uncharacterized protein (DUF2235 family)